MYTSKESNALLIAHKELAFEISDKGKSVAELNFAHKKVNDLQELLQDNFKEISDYKYALDELSIIDITDQNGIIKKVNNNFCLLSKYSKEELIGQDHRIVNSGYHSKEVIRNLWLTITSGKIWRGEIKNKAKDGTFFWVDTVIVPFLNEKGHPYQYLASRADITARKDTEEYLVQRTAQLETANKELVFQHKEKEKRAAELSIANKELAFQNKEKEKRAAELSIANKELAYQNDQKEKRAAELSIANKELAYQNEVKEKRAAELIIANQELAYQNVEKENRAAELSIANIELAYQNDEKEKRAAELSIANIELAYQNDEKAKRAAELSVANKELAFQNKEKEKRAAELGIANKELAFQNDQKEKRAEELVIANNKLAYQNKVKEKRAAELSIANKELAFQNHEKEKRAAELNIANIELAFQNEEKENRAAELSIANKELAFQNEEKEKRAAELSIANKELAYQNDEKEKRAAELSIANKELAYQNEEKENRAAELSIANKELAFQNEEKEKRAAELSIANKELAFQNEEKENRAAELSIANKELAFQNHEKEKRAIEKEKRAAELIIANKELAFENEEKEKRAAELIIANEKLVFQNGEKEKRAAELNIANIELAYQNEEKEKRAAELSIANKELEAFSYVSSHDLQEPLRKIQIFTGSILENETQNLSENGKYNFNRIQSAVGTMRQLIDDLLSFSRISTTERKFENIDLDIMIAEVKAELKDNIEEKHATIEATKLGPCNIIVFQFRQLMYNLISNALKFSKSDVSPCIIIKSSIEKGSTLNNACLNDKAGQEKPDSRLGMFSPKKNYYHISVGDNGIGFEPQFSELIFEVFQRLHSKEKYAGTGIGLAIVKKIVENHNGIIKATSQLNKGATFDIYIPIREE